MMMKTMMRTRLPGIHLTTTRTTPPHRWSQQFTTTAARKQLGKSTTTTTTTSQQQQQRMEAIKLIRSMSEHVWPKSGHYSTKARVVVSLVLLGVGKAVTLAVPFLFKRVVDDLSGTPKKEGEKKEEGDETHPITTPTMSDNAVLAIALTPGLSILLYGIARAASSGLSELRDVLFAKVSQEAIRKIALDTFEHLHRLDLRWHLGRNIGGLTRVIDRGTRSVDMVLKMIVLRIIPTALELGLVTSALAYQYALVSTATMAAYSGFTVAVTSWRMKFRQDMNKSEARASTRAVDSLLNYETVKYFNNEAHEARAYDAALRGFETGALKTQTSLSLLNFGQVTIFSVGLTAVMYMVAGEITAGTMQVGDLVLVNGLLAQLAIPLNFVGTVYRETKQGVQDMEEMFKLRLEKPGVCDAPGATPLVLPPGISRDGTMKMTPIEHLNRDGEVSSHLPAIEFENCTFRYESGFDPILRGLTLSVRAGETVGVVGTSGSGKSTLLRLIFRFFDVESGGSVRVFGQDVRGVTGDSLRRAIAVIPQDTVLFNDTLYHNVAYGNLDAPRERVMEAARLARLDELIERLPHGFETLVGERGLKLSGGERQRCSVARAVLKDAPILLCDEATSALDGRTESEVMASLRALARGRTTVIVAHRLSTVQACDRILVMDKGEVVEQGMHEDLISRPGGLYAEMWKHQAIQKERQGGVVEERKSSDEK